MHLALAGIGADAGGSGEVTGMAWIPDVSRTLVIIKRLEKQEDVLGDSVELFQAFFSHTYSPEEFTKRMEELGELLSESQGHFVDPEIAAAVETAIRDPAAGVELVVDRLHELAPLFDVSYEPDGSGHTPLVAASIHYHASLLVRAMRRSSIGEKQYGYGDDVGPVFMVLKQLWLRYGEADSPTLLTIRSLFWRVGAELASQTGDYAAALPGLALSLKAFVQSEDQASRIDYRLVLSSEDRYQLPPWLDGVEDRAKAYIAHLGNLPEGQVDWAGVIDSCQTLKDYLWVEGSPTRGGTDVVVEEETDYWNETIGWAKAQLTPSQLRSLLEKSDNKAVTVRLSQYFFDGGMWDRLSEDARNALVVCDSVWMADGPESRLLQILSPLQRATEDTLYHYLWQPLVEWAGTKPDYSDYPGKLLVKSFKQYPGLTEYIEVLRSTAGRSYLGTLAIEGEDRKFLSKDVPMLLCQLRNNRNQVEHEPDSRVDLNDIKDLYRAYIGIGRRGVINELVRLLGRASM